LLHIKLLPLLPLQILLPVLLTPVVMSPQMKVILIKTSKKTPLKLVLTHQILARILDLCGSHSLLIFMI
jgi:hypothetical protein